MPQIDFERDVTDEIVRYFNEHGIMFDLNRSTNPSYLLERYFRSRAKMIFPRPRSVHHSAELGTRLDMLEERYHKPFATIEERFETGGDLTEFLSKLASRVDKPDAMLNDFGIHHLHLGKKRFPKGKR